MSSLAATQADGYYYPPEWRPERGSLNQFRQSHPLGKRAKDLASDGVLVVRFEMPFHVWCLLCDAHIARGVRFNARKKKAGSYLTSTVWEFGLHCPSCSGELVIRTDPKQRGYELVSGLKQKAEAPLEGEEMQTEHLNDPQLAVKLQSDPFLRLEHENEDKRAAEKRSRGLDALVELQDAEFKDDYASNSALRAQFRSKKKQRQSREQEAARLGLSIPLLDVHPDDVLASRAVVFKDIPQKRRSSRHRSSHAHKSPKSRSRAAKTPVRTNSFQHFGDPVGSQLQRLKAAKRAAKKRTPAPSQT